MKQGKVIVISGPSGCGKGTIINELLKLDSNFKLSVSMTTRQPRPYETNGVEYFFVTKEEFERRIEAGDLLEYTCYNSNYYGTPKSEIEKAQASGTDILLDIEVEGAENARHAGLDNLITIFIVPPSFEELKKRLICRGTEDAETISKRLLRAEEELIQQHKYDYIVVNDCLDDAVKNIYEIIKK